MKAVIMAGGAGTRLQSISTNIPKPMFPVLGKPVLEYQLSSLAESGIFDVTLIVGHLKEAIMDYFGDGHSFGVKIHYMVEEKPLGTAGALYYLKQEREAFILIFGDLMLDIDFNRFMAFHKERQAMITLYGHPNAHPYDSDIIVVNPNDSVTEILSKKGKRDFYYHNFVNAGAYCIDPQALETIQRPEKLDLEKNLIFGLLKSGNVYAYKCTEYVKDMGTPERLKTVSEDVANGIVSGRSLKRKQRAIFLDRDGTINEYVGFLRKAEQFRLLPGVAESVQRINASPYLAIVVTNQPVIARGEVSLAELEEIHKKMETELGTDGAYLDDIFFCPHHPHKGYPGEVAELKMDCECRKPKIGMILQAAEKYNIDLSASWYIGDTTMDVQTGKNAGMRTILLQTGEAGLDGRYDVTPDYIAENLPEAVHYILD